MASPVSVPTAGSHAGRYLLLRQLTSSHVGTLWEARCDAEQQLLALVRVVSLPGDIDSDAEQSLAKAAWDSMELDAESVVRVADIVFGAGWFALVHDHWDGETLATMQRRVHERKTAVPSHVTLRVLLDAIDAIQAVSESTQTLGVSWSPVTIDPSSLLVCDDGRTRLLDGFVADAISKGDLAAPRRTTTYAYATPEQFQDAAKLTERTAVFRLGIIAWELLTGKRLLLGSQQAVQRRLKSRILRADRVASTGPKVSEELARVVDKALSLAQQSRFATVADFGNALRKTGERVASQEDVIQFVDALVGRESTLARLLMDRPPLLSEAMKSMRPGPAIRSLRPDSEMAQCRVGQSRGSGASGQGNPAPRIGRPPDTMFGALPRVPSMPRVLPGMNAARSPATATAVAQPVSAAAQPVLAGAAAAAKVAEPISAAAAQAAAEVAPAAAPKIAPAAAPKIAPAAAEPISAAAAQAAARQVEPGPRERISTLVGLSGEVPRQQPHRLPPAKPAVVVHGPAPESIPPSVDAPAPDSEVVMGYPEPEAPDGADNDDLWDEPTQAYTGARLANVVRNVQSQELADSGLRLTGSPPAPSPPRDPQHEPAHQEGRGADVTEQQPERSATATKDLGDPVAALKTSQAVLTDAISRAVEDLPGQLRNTASEATVDLEGHAAAESELPLPLNPRWPWIPHWQWMQDHRILLPLVGFFALTTIILGIVTVSLAMGSNSSEQSAVTDATKAQLAQPATRKQPERAKTEARAPSTSKVKVVNATDTEPGTADNEDSSKDETDSSAEAEEDTDAEDEAQEGTATVPQPARPRTTWRTRRRKEPRAKHYVPNDI